MMSRSYLPINIFIPLFTGEYRVMLISIKTFPNIVHIITRTMIIRFMMRKAIYLMQIGTYPSVSDKFDDVVLFILDCKKR